ncbi:MAG TPA: MarR family transcriptional regulator [Acidimicrobiales bacterium]
MAQQVDDAVSSTGVDTRAQHVLRVEDALTTLYRIINGRDADKVRMERSGVYITRPRMSLLRALHDRGPMRIVDLGKINHMDKGYASRVWRSLAADGYIEVVDGTDPRSTTVALTQKGLDTYLRWRRANTEIVDEVLAGWSDADLVALMVMLERLARSFRDFPTPDAAPTRAG